MVRHTLQFAIAVVLLSFRYGAAAGEANATGDRQVSGADQRWLASDAAEVPEFNRHVVPMLGKLGCNNRACHGSFQGQNGFRLSLFGHDAKMDFAELTTDEGDGPRVNAAEPAKSLALLKPTGDEELASWLGSSQRVGRQMRHCPWV